MWNYISIVIMIMKLLTKIFIMRMIVWNMNNNLL